MNPYEPTNLPPGGLDFRRLLPLTGAANRALARCLPLYAAVRVGGVRDAVRSFVERRMATSLFVERKSAFTLHKIGITVRMAALFA